MPEGWINRIRNLTHDFMGAQAFVQMLWSWPAVQQAAPAGDGHPVLLIPGFGVVEATLSPLCRALREKGYDAHTWGGGFNLGLSEGKIDLLRSTLERLYRDNGNRKVTVIGHSLGGLFARELAREFPEFVRDAISIGSPFGVGLSDDKNAVWTPIRTLVELMNAGHVSIKDEDTAKRLLTPPPVPVTSVFSKMDTVANWKVCLNPATPKTENIEIKNASHLGLVYHPGTIAAVLDRLAQPEGAWKPYADASAEAQPANPQWKPRKGGGGAGIFKK